MQRKILERLLFTSLGALLVVVTAQLEGEATVMVATACVVYFYLAARVYKFDYLHPAIAFILPWSMILVFSVIPLSIHSRPMDPATYWVILTTVFAWLMGSAIAPPAARDTFEVTRPDASQGLEDFRPYFGFVTRLGFVFLYGFAALNVALAGYVPIVSLITTGDSRYLDFGVPSVYGAFLAYANALGCVAYYVYLRTHRRAYLILFLSVFIMHIALVTRQNLITLIVEAFVIRSLAIKRLSRVTVIWSVVLVISAFSVLGSIRSGDVKDLFGVPEDFTWVPAGIIWLYAYSYFNALNIDNMVTQSGAPFFDGSMLQTLLPTILRPETNHETLVEVAGAAAPSYIYPVYMDIGFGIVPWTGTLALLSALAYRKALERGRFVDVATYSCLFYCALFSFFTDFWMYLPVIFQLFFFRLFHVALFKAENHLARAIKST